jgi:S1-C subfamily serine protease
MVTLAEFTAEMVDYLGRADTAIDFVPPKTAAALADPSRQTEGRRRVSFGSIPDFNYDGEGVLLSGVLPNSPAAEAGLTEGDVIVAFDETPVADLTDYSEAMKRRAPGDRVRVEFLRDGERRSVDVTLVERR